jgi:preprotein translocase SecF subunit
MKSKRPMFVSIVAALSVLMALTTGFLVSHTRIGLEFQGGYELNFAVAPLNAGDTLTSEQVLQAANILSERANKLGMSEPQVNILGANEIRVVLAGVKGGNPSIATLRDPAGLPVQLMEKYSLSVGGVLGSEDLSNTLKAAGIAAGLIFLLLIIVYRGPGLVAVFAVTVCLWALVAAFNALDATVSLAAIVAYVLGIGIASDANILSFERIRDELRMNRPVGVSIRRGSWRAFRTIMDSNATVLICAVVLVAVGIGPILGFALTTILSIVLSFLINVVFVRFLLGLLYGDRTDTTPLFGKPWFAKPLAALNYVRIGKWASLVTAVFAFAGLYAVAGKPLNYDIEFKAGTALDIKLDKPITQSDATDMILSSGIAPATVAIGGDNQNVIATRFDDVLDTQQVNDVVDQFKEAYGPAVSFEENTADPGVARHLIVQSISVVLIALAATFFFILLRFGWRYAVASMVTVLTSVWFVVSCFALFYQEIDITFIAATLTVIGYTLNGVIVVFDRIRENLRGRRTTNPEELASLVNDSVAQVQRRTIYTALTVMTGSACLYQFGAEPLQMFSLAIFLGLLFGTVSSLVVAPVAWMALRPWSAQRMVPVTESN